MFPPSFPSTTNNKSPNLIKSISHNSALKSRVFHLLTTAPPPLSLQLVSDRPTAIHVHCGSSLHLRYLAVSFHLFNAHHPNQAALHLHFNSRAATSASPPPRPPLLPLHSYPAPVMRTPAPKQSPNVLQFIIHVACLPPPYANNTQASLK